MKTNDIKQIRDAFSRLSKSAEILEFPKEQTIKIKTDFKTIDNDSISFYAYMHGKSKKIFFTDAGQVYKRLLSSGQKIQESLMQNLVESYGLVLLPDNTLVEQQDEPLHIRISNIIQVQVGIDAMLRTWKSYANKIKTKKETLEENEL
jgi:hypothetical protein